MREVFTIGLLSASTDYVLCSGRVVARTAPFAVRVMAPLSRTLRRTTCYWLVEVFRAGYRGTIDMVLSADWTEPSEDVVADHLAAQRRQQFQVGWFAEPIWRGDYPKVMRELVGDR